MTGLLILESFTLVFVLVYHCGEDLFAVVGSLRIELRFDGGEEAQDLAVWEAGTSTVKAKDADA